MPSKLQITYVVEPDPAALAYQAAHHLVELAEEAVSARGRVRIAVSGGSTPKATFALLADPAHPFLHRMPWAQLELFFVDERTVPPDHPESNYRMTKEALLDHVSLHPDQIHRIQGELEPEVAAAEYEFDIRRSLPPGRRRSSALRHRHSRHGRRRPYRLALSSYRSPPRNGPAGRRQPGSAEGYLARYPHLAGHQSRPRGLLPHRRSRQSRAASRRSFSAPKTWNACLHNSSGPQAVYSL